MALFYFLRRNSIQKDASMRYVREFKTIYLLFIFFFKEDTPTEREEFLFLFSFLISSWYGKHIHGMCKRKSQYKAATSLQGTCKRNSPHEEASTGCVRETPHIIQPAWDM